MTAAEDDRQYEARVLAEAEAWRERQLRRPGLWDMATRATQDRINRIIPERVHQIVTSGVELTTRGIMTGADWTTARPLLHGSLRTREELIQTRVDFYRTTASVEGGDQGKLQELKGSPANFTPQFRKEFQQILKSRGYYNGPIDGDFGASTQNAIDRLAART